MDAGIRIGFAYTTLGLFLAPIEGFTGLKIRKTREGKDYLKQVFLVQLEVQEQLQVVLF